MFIISAEMDEKVFQNPPKMDVHTAKEVYWLLNVFMPDFEA